MLSAQILGVGVLGPGLSDWQSTAAVLRGEAPYTAAPSVLPPPAALPPAERRRAGRMVRLALGVGAQAVADAGVPAATLTAVFASSSGDGDTCHEICLALAGAEPAISPTRFHNSVHNAAAGYWSIAHGCQAPSTALCALDASFGAGLLEALLQLRCGAEAVLLAAYDVDYPPPLREHRPIPDAFGVALVLGAAPKGGTGLQLAFTQEPASRLSDPALEALRGAIPAARSLPLLQLLSHRLQGCVVLDYLPEQSLQLQLTP
ncbi:MAG TPA: beta-ketoacyl synthase chain length factor [Steroidobacteraceae bacterium]|nr:beta-ketoacyl synthase chain length factor [Steroidobacteraceae bacterium]